MLSIVESSLQSVITAGCSGLEIIKFPRYFGKLFTLSIELGESKVQNHVERYVSK